MGITKSQLFTEGQNKLAGYAKAIGHPARIAILQFLMDRTSCICNDLVEELPLSQSTISQHLKELKEAGLIKGEIDGPKVCYCIHDENWNEAKLMLQNMFMKKSNCC